MAKQDKSKLKDWFRTGKYPTQEQFWDWMDSFIHKDEKLGILSNFPELDTVLQQKADKEALNYHFKDDKNPHKVTKQQVGLGNVENTADVNKPVSKAMKAALDLKADKDTVGISNRTKAGTKTTPVMKFEQGELLTTPQNGAWEWDGNDLYFTVKGDRKRIIKESTFTYTRIDTGFQQRGDYQQRNQGSINSAINDVKTNTSYATPAGVLRINSGNNSLSKLNVLLSINLTAYDVPLSEFSVKTELLLNIENGLFSEETHPGINTKTSLKIAEISGVTNVGLKEIELPITSVRGEVLGNDPENYYRLRLSGINNIDGVKSEFYIPQIYLRDAANTKGLVVDEAIFSFTTKTTLTTKEQGATLASKVVYSASIECFTFNTIR